MSPAPTEGSRTAAVETALRAAAVVHGLRASGLVVVTDQTATYERVIGGWGDLRDGFSVARAESMAARLLDGAPTQSADAEHEPSYAGTAEVTALGASSFIAMPVPGALSALRPVSGPTADGSPHVLLVGLDPDQVKIDEDAAPLLRGLAGGLAAAWAVAGGPHRPEDDGRPDGPHPPDDDGSRAGRTALRRTRAGWVVESADGVVRPVGDLTSAMVMADLLADDLSPPGRPRRPEGDLTETDRLRLSVVQLEHALASRVLVEQAIGVLAERHGTRPREAFERLRRTARGLGRRVHDLARQVVDSAGDPRAPLPGELAGSRPPPRPAAPRPAPHRR